MLVCIPTSKHTLAPDYGQLLEDDGVVFCLAPGPLRQGTKTRRYKVFDGTTIREEFAPVIKTPKESTAAPFLPLQGDLVHVPLMHLMKWRIQYKEPFAMNPTIIAHLAKNRMEFLRDVAYLVGQKPSKRTACWFPTRHAELCQALCGMRGFTPAPFDPKVYLRDVAFYSGQTVNLSNGPMDIDDVRLAAAIGLGYVVPCAGVLLLGHVPLETARAALGPIPEDGPQEALVVMGHDASSAEVLASLPKRIVPITYRGDVVMPPPPPRFPMTRPLAIAHGKPRCGPDKPFLRASDPCLEQHCLYLQSANITPYATILCVKSMDEAMDWIEGAQFTTATTQLVVVIDVAGMGAHGEAITMKHPSNDDMMALFDCIKTRSKRIRANCYVWNSTTLEGLPALRAWFAQPTAPALAQSLLNVFVPSEGVFDILVQQALMAMVEEMPKWQLEHFQNSVGKPVE